MENGEVYTADDCLRKPDGYSGLSEWWGGQARAFAAGSEEGLLGVV
jgi:hypothetical protein